MVRRALGVATAYFDARHRVRVVDTRSVAVNPSDAMNEREITRLADMVFGPQH